MSEDPNDQPMDETTPEGADPGAGDAAQPAENAEDAVENAAAAADEAAESIESDGTGMDDEAAAALAAAMDAVNSTKSDADNAVDPSKQESVSGSRLKPDLTGATPMGLADLAVALGPQHSKDTLDLLSDVELHVRVELGRTRMYVEDILQLSNGAVVELDKLAGDPVDVYVNERHVARGEVLVLNDNFCIRVNEIIDPGAKTNV